VTGEILDIVLCPCGSGLRRVRCCDLDKTALPDQTNVALLDPMAQDATKLFNEKKYAEAEARALQLLDLAPNQRLALRILFEIRKAQNRVRPAEILARRLAALPGTPAIRAAANGQLAQYIVAQGRYADALAPAAAALMATPKDATAQHVMGVVLTETGRLQSGERHYRRALALLGRDDGLILANTAWNLKLQGRLGEAAKLYERALGLRADNKRGLGGHAQVEFLRGNFLRAIALLDDGLVRWPHERTLRLLRALADLGTGKAQAVLERLSDPPENLLAAELCVRGQALARLGRPAEAVQSYAAAKRMQRERHGQSYEPAPYLEKAAAYKAYFTADRVQPLPRAATPAARTPVFLLGFPRSGSSLLEQLLAQIPGFAAGNDFAPVADLLPLVPALAGTSASYPEALDHALVADGLDLPRRLRARYDSARAQLGLNRPGVKYVTDRSETNAWHLGLIKLLFPDAPIIHVLRHPLDVALSNLSQDRKLEANCGVSLPAIARHYALTMEMISHFRGQLTLRYMPLRYEDLVAQPVETLRQILAFIGADSATVPAEFSLRANDARLPDPTPAHFATREPIHNRGRYRHQEYEKAMPKLFSDVQDILRPWTEALGYAEGAKP
jgi:tetratricopeptide (TPR) repeat protein